MFYFIIIVIVLALVVLFFIMKNKKNNDTKNEIKEVPQTPIDKLLTLNINIRKNIYDKELLDEIESIIDQLRDTLPILNESYKASELTWVANKMATDYLQKVINPFMKFKKEEQEQNKNSLLESLAEIKKELNEIISLVKDKKTSSFDTKAKFIKNRFK